ncbi:hypothetical protein OE88DRAFT_1664742 [Heliocybe sulcata]|uniref:Membrane insertase YidC/Oxa/ALB C-terminal domain-containing protein n=1 Tax=Heliocybe sulcata TaxID=5364 RepID=A0A5C3MU23_9AGAM|nr:hypothetical protein OE88DRAFT_1664742 [Heliocybe sulcata]
MMKDARWTPRSHLPLRPSDVIHPLGVQSCRSFTVVHARRAPAASSNVAPLTPEDPSRGLQSSPATLHADSSAPTPAVPSTADVVPPADALANAADQSASLVPATIPPIQYGDLENLGLTSWSPIGLSAWALEIINTTTGLPWLHTIVIGTMLSRALIFPMSIISMREAAKMAPIQPLISENRKEMAAAQASRNQYQMQKALLTQKKIFEEAGVKPARMMFFNLIPLPISLGMFFAVRRLCDLPLEQMKMGGLPWFDGIWLDLTVTDPTYILPVITVGIINAQLRLAGRDMQTQGRPEMAHLINGFHVFSLLCSPLMFQMSIGMLFNLLSSVAFYSCQILLLRNTAIRQWLKIPPLPPAVKLPNFWESFQALKLWYQKSVADARAQAMRRK